MILLDTSIVIAALRGRTDAGLRLLLQAEGAICGVVRAEVLHGARGDSELTALSRALDAFHQALTPEAVWQDLGQSLYLIRSRGITVPISDALIATLAIHHGLPIWTLDSQFELIRKVMPQLRLSLAALPQ